MVKDEKLNSPNLLFISYAGEDRVFASWLARKLAFYGYGVWFDELKLLGGESWVHDIDSAIRDKSFRVLALLSEHSLTKPKPLKERTLAQEVGTTREMNDFLITLNLDGSNPDWTLSDISSIPFKNSWADGLRRVLKKLRSIDAPKLHGDNPSIAGTELNRGHELVSSDAEDLIVNWMPFAELPDLLVVYEAPGVDNKELMQWPCYRLEKGRLISLFPPPSELAGKVTKTKEVYLWSDMEKIGRTDTHNIIVQILNRAVSCWFRKAGCHSALRGWESYLPATMDDSSRIKFKDLDGKERYIRNSGKITFRVPSGPPEKIIYHNSIRHRVRKLDSGQYAVELIPAVALFDSKNQPIEGRKINARRKKVTAAWYNDKWRVRMLAYGQLLQKVAVTEDASFGLEEPMILTADKSLKESDLKMAIETPEAESEENREVVIGNEELEEWRK